MGCALAATHAVWAAISTHAVPTRWRVVLAVDEPSGVDRRAAPVTSGIPLPQGVATNPAGLTLIHVEGRALVPCQFTPLCRWPDGSLKWVLLDFQADVAASNRARYVVTQGPPLLPKQPVRLLARADGLVLETGPLCVGIDTNKAGLIHAVSVRGMERVTPQKPIQVELITREGVTYQGSRPLEVVAECVGPLRTTIRVRGRFEDATRAPLLNGKVGYDARITAYAGQADVTVDFTLRQDGWYGYRNEGPKYPRQWLAFRSLSVTVPVTVPSGNPDGWSMVLPMGWCKVGPHGARLIQWFKYPGVDARGYWDILPSPDARREARAGMENRYGFYWCVEAGWELVAGPGERAPGWGLLCWNGEPVVGVAIRRFWQEFPRGLEAKPGVLRCLLWPEGGFWPRAPEAAKARTYQFEGGRRKTCRIALRFGSCAVSMAQEVEQPLVARAPLEAYRDSRAVFPLAAVGIRCAEEERQEVIARMDRLQMAKIHAEMGDPAGPHHGMGKDRWGRVSLPSLRERCPEILCGWMNYGDLVWDFGYCSLFYDWPYGMLLQYLRFGDRGFFDEGDDMARHRYDIDQYHVEHTAPHLGGLQRYERGQHGHLSRQERKKGRNRHWEANAHASHTWNRGLLLHWALTGDPRSRDAAEQNGRAFYRLFYQQNNLRGKDKWPMTEFRVPAWAMDNWLALYEYTGEQRYLEWANEVFDKTLLAMERDNGSQGHIVKGGRQGAQFVGYVVEPVCRLHALTGRADAVAFLKRVLDWQRREGVRRGRMQGTTYFPLLFIETWDAIGQVPEAELSPYGDPVYGWMLADGYAYLYRVLGDQGSLAFGRQAMRDAVFYTGGGRDRGCAPSDRMPLGYHHTGSPFSSAAKVHAYTSRYGQWWLWVEENLAENPSVTGRGPEAGYGEPQRRKQP